MDYSQMVDDLIAGCDLSTETGRKIAYSKCEEYAEENLRQRRAFNDFMEVVAERLGMPPTRLNSFRDTVGDPPENARICVKLVEENLAELTGNADGLRYLAGLMLELARDGVEHDHAHLYADELPMCGDVYLTIYHEPDAWFEHLTEQDEKEEEGPASVA